MAKDYTRNTIVRQWELLKLLPSAGSGKTIKEIGEHVGLPDVQHFTTVFKRHTGLTPATFRKQHGTQFANPSGPRHVEEG